MLHLHHSKVPSFCQISFLFIRMGKVYAGTRNARSAEMHTILLSTTNPMPD